MSAPTIITIVHSILFSPFPPLPFSIPSPPDKHLFQAKIARQLVYGFQVSEEEKEGEKKEIRQLTLENKKRKK